MGLHKVFFLKSDLQIDSLKSYPKNFLISRSDAPRRKILNEQLLSQKLLERNISTIRISEYTFEECIYLFRNAKCVISTHSAALTNILFSQKGTHVIEVFEKNAVLPYYYELAKSLELEYVPIILQSDKNVPSSRYQIQEEDIEFDLNELLKHLEKSLV
jgi:capsular polysaccharide biosynthesis protein